MRDCKVQFVRMQLSNSNRHTEEDIPVIHFPRLVLNHLSQRSRGELLYGTIQLAAFFCLSYTAVTKNKSFFAFFKNYVHQGLS